MVVGALIVNYKETPEIIKAFVIMTSSYQLEQSQIRHALFMLLIPCAFPVASS